MRKRPKGVKGVKGVRTCKLGSLRNRCGERQAARARRYMRWRVHDIIYTRVRDIDARYGTIRAVTRKEKKRLFIDIVVRDTDGRIAQQHRARNKEVRPSHGIARRFIAAGAAVRSDRREALPKLWRSVGLRSASC